MTTSVAGAVFFFELERSMAPSDATKLFEMLHSTNLSLPECSLLKPDNLARICNNISEKVLRRKLQVGCRENCHISATMAPITATNCALAAPSPAISATSRSVW